MSLRVLKDEAEFSEQVLRGGIARLARQRIHVSIRGPNIPPITTAALASEVQRIIAAELEQVALPKPGKTPIKVLLGGLALPDAHLTHLETAIRERVQSMLPELSGQGSTQQEILICACGFGGGCCDPPGQNQRLDDIDPLPLPKPGQDYLLIEVCLKEDVLLMKVEDGARFNLNSDQIMIGLTSSTEWAKEIQAWQYCLCGVATVHQDSANSNPVWMLATSDQVATIVFRKPKFLGIWTDMYHFEPEQFWRLLGGKVLTFDWKCDYCNCV